MKHVDDWLDEISTDAGEIYAKRVLEIARAPAFKQYELSEAERHPPLFCDYQSARYRCTGASRLGDVWLTEDFEQKTGYQKRVDVAECHNWGEKP